MKFFFSIVLIIIILFTYLFTLNPTFFKNSNFITLIVSFLLLTLTYFISNNFIKKIQDIVKKDIENILTKKIGEIFSSNNKTIDNYTQVLVNETNQELKLSSNKNELWKKILEIFSTEHKTEIYNLAKKYNFLDTFYIETKEKGFFRIFYLSHILDLLYSFQEALININNEKATSPASQTKNTKNQNIDKELELINELIAKIRLYKYATTLRLATNVTLYILLYTTILLLLTSVMWLFKNILLYDDYANLINIADMYQFFLGTGILLISLPFVYMTYSLFQIYQLKIETDKHDNWHKFFTKIIRYIIFFILFTMLVISGFTVLLNAGIEYRRFFSLVAKSIFPIIHLNDIKNFSIFSLINNSQILLQEEFIFIIIILKILFILFISFLGYVLIKQSTEKYLEFYDNHKDRRHMLPPEFIKIFNYLILFIITIILLYGTLFINYPELLTELTNNSPQNCGIINTASSINTQTNTHSLTDYLPLSIFLALFGAIFTMATKDLLENYFAGLSLKINSPYETGERVTINGEMMEVISSGIRADKFYGINTNTEITIPHKKLVQSDIINYTQPTLDYRQTITINIVDKSIHKSIPREAEKVLLLSAFINTGVKKPEIQFKSADEEKLRSSLKKYKTNLEKYFSTNKDSSSYIKSNTYKDCEENVKANIEDIWINFKKQTTDFKRNLFLEKIEIIIGENNIEEHKQIIMAIKKIVASILITVMDYQEKEDALYWHLDEYCVKRKYKTFNHGKKLTQLSEETINDFHKTADLLVNISYEYFALAKQIWRLKENIQPSLKKTQVDSVSLALLNVPRVTSIHKRDDYGAYWEVSLLITAELGEQSDEIIHHVNIYIDELLEIFELPTLIR